MEDDVRLIQVREKEGNYFLFVTYGLYPKVPHEPEVVEVLCEDLLSDLIRKLNLKAKITARVIRLKDLSPDIDDGGEEFHYCEIIETLDKPSLEKIKLLAEMIKELPPTLL